MDPAARAQTPFGVGETIRFASISLLTVVEGGRAINPCDCTFTLEVEPQTDNTQGLFINPQSGEVLGQFRT